MIVPDLNLLVYCFNASASEHSKAVAWWEGLLSSSSFVGVPWVVYVGFLRLMTGRHVLREPYAPQEVTDLVAEWFQIPSVRLLVPSEDTRRILEDLIRKYDISGGLVTDAAIVASAIEHNATLHSNDTDFGRFTELQVHNPLAPA